MIKIFKGIAYFMIALAIVAIGAAGIILVAPFYIADAIHKGDL